MVATERGEIEALRSIRSLIGEYTDSTVQKNPLSIAVFGAPGTGKSFTIRAVAESLAHSSSTVKELTFNLSPVAASTEIRDSLHQVRDIALSGKLPLGLLGRV